MHAYINKIFYDLIFQGFDAKRQKLASPFCSSQTSGVSASTEDTRIRKSRRHRRMRGEKELTVSSKLTLLELKVMVSSCFPVTLCSGTWTKTEYIKFYNISVRSYYHVSLKKKSHFTPFCPIYGAKWRSGRNTVNK